VVVTLQETANEINKMKRSLLLYSVSRSHRGYICLAGDHLQEKVRSWLSPPDPSKNHITSRGAHHGGTAEWFTQSDTFEEWNTKGSLLWVHGKRTSSPYLPSIPVVDHHHLLICSGLWQEYSLVRVNPHRLPQHVDSTEQLHHYSRGQDEMRSRISSDGILLL